MSTAQNVYNQTQTIPEQKAITRKCWICLTNVEFDGNEILVLKKLFFSKNLYNNMKDNIKENFVQLRPLFNKVILSACKCPKKLAHLSCFNKYIDMKHSGNINTQIKCSQCNLEYEFFYPYNGIILQIFDFIDQFLNVTSTVATVGSLITAAYWSSLSYGLLTMLQIYGSDEGIDMIKNNNIIISATVLPSIPIVLILSRFIKWEKTIEKFFPSCFQYKTSFYYKKSQYEINNRFDDNDENELENSKILKKIRLVIGGLALPSLAVLFDKIIFNYLVGSNKSSSLIRTTMVGLTFVGVKGIAKMIYRQKKSWEEENKSIQDYKT